MAVRYTKLWKILVEKKLSKTDLRDAAGISTNVLAKLGKDEPVSVDSLERICHALSCDIGDIMEIIPQDDSPLFDEPSDYENSKIEIYDPAYKIILDVDWSFINSKQDTISLLHPYPARFIEELPRQLISIFGCPDGQIIFDPFCGSGTTLVEAQHAGVPSVGVDINPIACLISRVKTSILDDDFIKVSECVYESALNSYENEYVSIPDIPNLDHWFKLDIQKALSSLMMSISTYNTSEANKDALSFALSSIIVRVSNQESDTRYAAVEKNVSAIDTFRAFQSACKKLAIAKQETAFSTPASVIERDILTTPPTCIEGKVGLVITSPPYPNAYEYWLYHKYRMWWLGYDPIAVRSYEIGARPHYQKKNGQTEKDFELQMNAVFCLLNSCMAQSGHVCFVIGRSIIKGKVVDNAALITRVATANGFTPIAKIPREIASTRKSFNLSYGKINTEYILVFRKG